MKHSDELMSKILSPKSLDEFWSIWPFEYFESHGRIERLPSIFQLEIFKSFDQILHNYEGRITINRGSETPYTFSTDVKKGQSYTLLDMGCVIQFSDVTKLIPDLSTFVETLGKELGIKTKHITPALFIKAESEVSEGLPFHFDSSDVLIVQTHGEKLFHIAKNELIDFPSGYQVSPGFPPHEDHFPQLENRGFPEHIPNNYNTVHLKQGSTLFMPRGMWHKSEAQLDSISINFVMRPPTAIDYTLASLKNLLLQSAAWRYPLYFNDHNKIPINHKDHLKSLLIELPKALDQLDLNYFMGILSQANHTSTNHHIRYVKYPGTFFKMNDSNNNKIKVEIDKNFFRMKAKQKTPSTTFTLSAEIKPLFDWLNEKRGSFSFENIHAAFPDFALDDVHSLLSLLEDEKAIKKISYPKYTSQKDKFAPSKN